MIPTSSPVSAEAMGVKIFKSYSPRELPANPGVNKAIHEVTFLPRDPNEDTALKAGVPLQIPENTPDGSTFVVISHTPKGEERVQIFKAVEELDKKQGKGVCVVRIKEEGLLPAVKELMKTELGRGLKQSDQQKKADEVRRVLTSSDITKNPLPSHFQRVPTTNDAVFTVGVLTPRELERYRFESQIMAQNHLPLPNEVPAFTPLPKAVHTSALLTRLQQASAK